MEFWLCCLSLLKLAVRRAATGCGLERWGPPAFGRVREKQLCKAGGSGAPESDGGLIHYTSNILHGVPVPGPPAQEEGTEPSVPTALGTSSHLLLFPPACCISVGE